MLLESYRIIDTQAVVLNVCFNSVRQRL